MDLYEHARLVPYLLAGRHTICRAGDLVAAGLTRRVIHRRARQGRLRRTHLGTYLLSPRAADLLDLIRAALLVSPPGTVVGYQTAAVLHGFGVLDEPERVHVVRPAGTVLPDRREIVVHESVVPLGAPALVRGIPCVTPARCAIDLARTVPRADAVAVLDAALSTRNVTQADLVRELRAHRGLRGIVQARELVPLADERAECRQESQLRLILHDGGLRGFVPQLVVPGRGYRLDLADQARRIAAEYDGSSHLDRDRMRADRTRHNWLESQGWRMRYFTDRDLYHRPSHIVDVLRAAAHPPP